MHEVKVRLSPRAYPACWGSPAGWVELSRASGIWTSSWHLSLVSELDNELIQNFLSGLCPHMPTLYKITHIMNVPGFPWFHCSAITAYYCQHKLKNKRWDRPVGTKVISLIIYPHTHSDWVELHKFLGSSFLYTYSLNKVNQGCGVMPSTLPHPHPHPANFWRSTEFF